MTAQPAAAADPQWDYDGVPNVIAHDKGLPDTYGGGADPVVHRAEDVLRSQLQDVYSGATDTPFSDADPRQIMNSVQNPEGLLPLFGRAPFTPLSIDPLDAAGFQPPRRPVCASEFQGAMAPFGNPHGLPDVVQRARQRFTEASKFNSGRGAYDHYWPGSGGGGDQGFWNGEVMTREAGSAHESTRRIWREPTCSKTQLPFRASQNPKAISELPPAVGMIRDAVNADVRDYYRPPAPNAGVVTNRMPMYANPLPRFTNRAGTEIQQGTDAYFADSAGREGGDPRMGPAFGGGMNEAPPSRCVMTERDVRPKKDLSGTYWTAGAPIPGRGAQTSGFQDTHGLQLRETSRGSYEDGSMGAPMEAGGDNSLVPAHAVGAHGGGDPSRPNDVSARRGLRSEYEEFTANHSPLPNVFLMPQSGVNIPPPAWNHQLGRPDIQSRVDGDLLRAYASNPYTQVIPGAGRPTGDVCATDMIMSAAEASARPDYAYGSRRIVQTS